jgi:hypothetical protein
MVATGRSPGPSYAVRCHVECVHWCSKTPIERIVEDPDNPIDLKALNDAIPVKEWEAGFDGNPKPPWVRTYVNFFVDPDTGAKLIVSNSTAGQKVAYEVLLDRTIFMRKFRGEAVLPVIKLSSKAMKTKWGVKQRPDFEIVDWKSLGGPNGAAQIAGPVAPLTPAEIVDDGIPWDDGLPF